MIKLVRLINIDALFQGFEQLGFKACLIWDRMPTNWHIKIGFIGKCSASYWFSWNFCGGYGRKIYAARDSGTETLFLYFKLQKQKW